MWVLLTFLEKIKPCKYCLWEVDLVFYMKIFRLMCQSVNLFRKRAVYNAGYNFVATKNDFWLKLITSLHLGVDYSDSLYFCWYNKTVFRFLRTQSNISYRHFFENSCSMLEWILNTPLELHEKNKEKQAFLLIHANTLLLFYYIYIYIYIYINFSKPRGFEKLICILYIYIYIYVYILYSDSIKCKRKSIARCEICLNSITKTPY